MRARSPRCLLTCTVFAFLGTATLAAQPPPGGRVEVGTGFSWFGAVRFDPINATQAIPQGGRRVVFRTTSESESSAGPDVRIGFRLTPRLQVESVVARSSTRLSTHISGDVELAPDTTASESVTQYLIGGGVVLHLSPRRSGRLAPFASAGVGYLRQLNEGRTLIEVGRSFYIGAGTHYMLRSGGSSLKSAGLRADVRALIVEGGVALDEARHVLPSLGASLFLRF